MKNFEKAVDTISFLLFVASLVMRIVPFGIESPLILTGLAIILPYPFFGNKLMKKSRVHFMLHSLLVLSAVLCAAGMGMGLSIFLVVKSVLFTYDGIRMTHTR